MKVLHRWLILPCFLAMACGDGGNGTTPDGEAWNLTVAISGSERTLLAGDQLTLTVEEIRDGIRRAVAASALEWRIVSGAAVTVNAAGVVTSVQPGTSVIEARRGEETVTFTIVVSPRPVTTIQLGQVTTMVRGDTATMALTGVDDHGAVRPIVDGALVSRTPSVVEVIGNGRIVGLATGSAMVVASSGTLRDSVTVQVTLGEPVSLGMQLGGPVAAGDSVLATFAAVDRRNNPLPGVSIALSSGNTLVAEPRTATVGGTGAVWIKAKTAGLATIHATSGGATGSAVLSVGAPRLLALHAAASAPFFFWQDSVSLAVTGDFSDGSSGPVTADVAWTVVTGADRFATSNGRVRTVGAPFVGSVRRDVGATATLRATVGALQADVTVSSGSQRAASVQIVAPAAALTGDIVTLGFVYRDSTGAVLPLHRLVGTRALTPASGAVDKGGDQWQLTVAGTAMFSVIYTEGGVAPIAAGVSIAVTPSAPDPEPEPDPGYLELQFAGTMAPAIQAAFTAARDRINQVLPFASNKAPVTLNVGAGWCGATTTPALNRSIPGVFIVAEVAAIDGTGGILGQAGPCHVRSAVGAHPLTGYMKFDAADLSNMVANNTIGPVILHEMLHVIGIGTLWSYAFNPYTSGFGGGDSRWSGPLSKVEYQLMGGLDFALGVPVENTGGSGTRDSHWRESVFGNELMTGWINGAVAPFSRMSIASLADMLYTVNYASADAFTLLSGLQATSGMSAGSLHLGAGEVLEQPMYRVSPAGNVSMVAGAPAWRTLGPR